ncbi:MAG: phage baseplate assembly protein V [Treponema sp.]|nr:phage baseplate assembly protein V [Treponema sp.]
MIDIQREIENLLRKHPDPRKSNGVAEFETRLFRENCPPTYGIVVDNKDPECLGRLRVQLPLVGGGTISPWYQTLNMWASNEQGLWCLPNIGTQVVVCFPYGDRAQGIVLGCIYDMQHKPPKTSASNSAESYLWQTKNHRLELIDEDGNQGVRIETAEGKIRCILTKDKGIDIANELGDIKIKCKKLKIESGDNIDFVSKKGTKLTCEDAMNIKSKKNTTLTADKEIKLKGKNIKLSGSKGVTAEGKQIAVEGDKVMGMDTHIMVVPAGMSTANVPLPHPFIGKLKDKLSKDVKIKDKKCATKDSVAKHDDSMHMQLPGTIKFQKNPKKEGKVTGGTSRKVKINGKEAAVIGSQVSTCNDMGMQNNSTIIAMGASIPMPAIINPANTEEWKRERDKAEKKEPKFSSVKWAKSSCEEGEEIELTANVQDITDGNMVTLQVFPEGKGPEDSVALAKFPLFVKGGSVSAKWLYRADQRELPPDSDPKFVFTAHSAWCNFEKSSNSLEVKLVRPEITKAEWQDAEGSSTSKGLVGRPLKLVAETKDMEGGVTFWIYDDKGREVTSIGAEIKGDKAEAEWTYHWDGTPLKEKPKFKFTVTGNRCKKVESGDVEISGKIKITIKNTKDEVVSEQPYSIYLNGDIYENGESDSDGLIEYEDLVPGNYQILIKSSKEE